MKAKKLSIPVSPEVASFAVCLESYLASRGLDHCESWDGIPIESILKQLQAAISQLNVSRIGEARPRAIFERAIIIGCYAMMVSELAYQRNQTEKHALAFTGYPKDRIKA